MADGPVALIVMGPSSVGKTTIATMLSKELGWRFAEADEFHPPENIARMSAGTPLTDADRWPWLESIRDWISARARDGESTVLTCSALKRRYRDLLATAAARVRFVELYADREIIAARMAARTGHYMPPSLLQSQFADLERLENAEDGVRIDVAPPPETVVRAALDALGLDGGTR